MPLSKYDIELDLANAPDTSHAYLVELAGRDRAVLDVGCDTGYLGEVLTTLGSRVWGVEIDETTAAAARTKLIDVVVADLEAGDLDLAERFGDQKFDVVVFGDVLEHLRDPLPVLRRATSLLAPGGCVLISTPNVAHGDIRLALLAGRWRYTPVGILDVTHTRFFTRETLVEFVHDAGFVVDAWRRTSAPLFGTETVLDPAQYPSVVVEPLQEDLEAITYQFVIRIVPGEAGAASEPALELDAANVELHRTRVQLQRAQAGAAAVAGDGVATDVLTSSRADHLPRPLQRPARTLAARIRAVVHQGFVQR